MKWAGGDEQKAEQEQHKPTLDIIIADAVAFVLVLIVGGALIQAATMGQDAIAALLGIALLAMAALRLKVGLR